MMMGPTKKKVITAGVIAFIIPVVVGSFMFMKYKKGVEEEMARLRVETATVERYVFANSLTAGEIITKGDLKLAKIKEESAPKDSYTDKKNINSKNVNSVLDVDTLIGRRVRINAEEKTIVASSMLVTEDERELTIDQRFQEFNSILLPSDLNSGDYIDIRLTMPSGENYIVIAGKEVKNIGSSTDSTTMYLQLTEEEILRTTAAILESYMGDGFKLYATKYVDPSAQLYTYKRVNLIEAYKEALKALVEERQAEADADPTAYKEKYHIETSSGSTIDLITGALGGKETIKVTEADITLEEIATRMGLEVKQVKEIKKAVDENDEVIPSIVKISENEYEVSGDLSISDMLDQLGLDEDMIESTYTSVGGWVTELLEHIPEQNETAEYGAFKITVLQVKEQSVEKIRLIIDTSETEKD